MIRLHLEENIVKDYCKRTSNNRSRLLTAPPDLSSQKAIGAAVAETTSHSSKAGENRIQSVAQGLSSGTAA